MSLVQRSSQRDVRHVPGARVRSEQSSGDIPAPGPAHCPGARQTLFSQVPSGRCSTPPHPSDAPPSVSVVTRLDRTSDQDVPGHGAFIGAAAPPVGGNNRAVNLQQYGTVQSGTGTAGGTQDQTVNPDYLLFNLTTRCWTSWQRQTDISLHLSNQ